MSSAEEVKVTAEDLQQYEAAYKKNLVKRHSTEEQKLNEYIGTIRQWQKEKRFGRLISLYKTLDQMKCKSDEVKRIIAAYRVNDGSNQMGFTCDTERNLFSDTYFVSLEHANPKIHDVLVNDKSIVIEIGETVVARNFKELNGYHLYALECFLREFPVFENRFDEELKKLVKPENNG